MRKNLIIGPMLSAVLIAGSMGMVSPAQAAVEGSPSSLSASSFQDSYKFTWDEAPGASAYRVQVSADQGFTKILEDVNTYSRVHIAKPALTSDSARTLYWRVAAYGTSTTISTLGAWSEVSSLDVNAAAAPSLTLPANSAVFNYPAPVKFSWTQTKGSIGYEVQYAPNSDFNNSQAIVTTAVDSNSFTPTNPLVNGNYGWRVRSKLLAGGTDAQYSAWSTPRAFTVQWQDSDSTVTLVSPAESNTSTPAVSDPLFTWQPVAGASYYTIKVARNADMSNLLISETKVYGTSFVPATEFLNGEYYWTVTAYDTAGNKGNPNPPSRKFVKIWGDQAGPNHATSANVLATPATNFGSLNSGGVLPAMNFRDFYFEWAPVPRATAYKVTITPIFEGTEPTGTASTVKPFVCRTANNNITQIESYTSGNVGSLVKGAGSCFSGVALTNVNKYLYVQDADGSTAEPRRYYWRVQAIDYTANQTTSIQSGEPTDTLLSGESPQRFFTFDGSTPGVPTSYPVAINHANWDSQYDSAVAGALSNNIADPAPLLDWEPVTGATCYQVRAYRAVNKTDVTNHIATIETLATQLRLNGIFKEDNTDTSTSYEYKVKALTANGSDPCGNEMGIDPWDSTIHDAVYWTRTTTPAQIPSDYLSQRDGAVLLSWTPQFTTNNTEGASRGYSLSYRLQSTNTWTEVKVEYPFWVASKTTGAPLADGVYEFRVAPLDGNGDVARYSETKTFTISPSTPSGLTVTTNGSSIDASWSPGNVSEGYQIQWRKDNGTWTQYPSSSTVVKQTALKLDLPDGPAAGVYDVQVRSRGNGGAYSSWSNTASVTINDTPVNVTVGDGITLNTTDRVLSWEPVAGATRYLVQYGNSEANANSATPIEVVGTSFAPPTTLTYGTEYFWRVTAVSESYNGTAALTRRVVLGTSATENFYVTTPPITPSIKTITLAEGNQAIVTWTGLVDIPSGTGGDVSYAVRYRPANQVPAADWITTEETPADTTSLTIQELSKATVYEFQLQASNSEGHSAWSASKTITTAAEPNAPKLLRVTKLNNNSATLAWSAPDNNTGAQTATSYEVSYRQGGSEWITVNAGLVTSYTITGLQSDTDYEAEVRAVNSIGTGTAANITFITKSAPSAVRSLKAVGSSGKVDLSWAVPTTPGSEAITGYVVESRVKNGSSWTTWAEAETTSANTTKASLTAVNGKVYEYRVFAKSSVGNGEYSNVVQVNLARPGKVKVKLSTTKGKVAIKWTKASPGGSAVTQYIVQYSANGKKWATLKAVSGKTTKYVTTKGQKNKTFYARVIAKNIYGNGAPSATAKIRKK